MDLTRHILIVDDSKNLDSEIKQYKHIFGKIKEEQQLDYNIVFHSVKKYEQAIKVLEGEECTFDVLIIDYDLRQAGNEKYGSDLVKEIRERINKHCKIIFYSMGDLVEVFPDRNDLINLFNEGIYRFLSKDTRSNAAQSYGQSELQVRVETIIDAIKNIDFVQVSLERYFAEYSDIIVDERIRVKGKKYTIEEIITLIKRDEETGRIYKSNLAESMIIHNILSGE
ncbi:response regulator transcription factor [Paenibacillus sp. GM2]|uniref:response regulator transcription factor n=1 Tax=Paenibacillus sp. GM2 TaxID=1622070 RepID=UPI0008389499|nr:response regulator transcription factor [Paenibacillus sp. GM2]